jgi:hypothetical protein
MILTLGKGLNQELQRRQDQPFFRMYTFPKRFRLMLDGQLQYFEVFEDDVIQVVVEFVFEHVNDLSLLVNEI